MSRLPRRIRQIARTVIRRLRNLYKTPHASPRHVGSIKSALIEEAAEARGLETLRADRRLVYVKIHGSFVPFEEMTGPSAGSVARYICDNKHHARRFLEGGGLEVARSQVIRRGEFSSASRFVDEVGYPVVVKPSSEARGRGVQTDIDNPTLLKKAIRKAGKWGQTILVEEQFDGDDYRVFVVDNKVISVTRRARASVVGDGASTIRQLIDAKNAMRRRNMYLRAYPIPTDLHSLSRLKRSGKSLRHVPGKGELVTLRDQSNLSMGGDSIDVTDTCHAGFKEVAARAVRTIPGLEYAGVDLLVRDITSEPQPGAYIVSEVEFFPGPVAHYPVEGTPRDMAGAVLDYYLSRLNGSSPEEATTAITGKTGNGQWLPG